MYTLTKEQIALIEADVEQARLTLLTLSQELTDHLCCEVENRMAGGKSFDEAYMEVKLISGITLLKKIEEDTILLTSKKQELMNKSIKITGNISLALIATGTLFKIFHWPGAAICLILGFAALLLFSFPAIIWHNNKEGVASGKTLMNLSAFVGGSMLMAGILFKVMHWPGANILLLSGWVFIIGLFLPVILWSKLKEAQSVKEKFIYSLGVVAAIVFELATLFKIMHWPGAGIFMVSGAFLLISCFLPAYSWMRFKESGKITGEFIFTITLSLYVIAMTFLMAMNQTPLVPNEALQQLTNLSVIH